MRHATAPLVLTLLLACGWSEDHFLVDGLPLWCDAAAACEGFTVDACIDHIRSQDRSSCDYDASAARRCAKAVEEEGVCEDLPALGTKVYIGPQDCDLVWPDCGALFPHPVPVGTSPAPTTED